MQSSSFHAPGRYSTSLGKQYSTVQIYNPVNFMYRAEFQPARASMYSTNTDNMAGTDRKMNDPNILKSKWLFKKK